MTNPHCLWSHYIPLIPNDSERSLTGPRAGVCIPTVPYVFFLARCSSRLNKPKTGRGLGREAIWGKAAGHDQTLAHTHTHPILLIVCPFTISS